MPTPASRAADPPSPSPHSPRQFPFSSCPDPDETSQHQSALGPPQLSQPIWRRSRHPGYTGIAEPEVASLTRLPIIPTMAPAHASIDDSEDQRPQAVVLIAGNGPEEDGPKQNSASEGGGNPAIDPMQMDGVRDTDAESGAVQPVAGPVAATGGAPYGAKSRVDHATPSTVDWDDVEMWDLMDNSLPWVEDSGLAGLGYECSQIRTVPTTSTSFLRPGSRFTGTQQSERQRYDVQVEIKHVDFRESFLCGYLKIQGLTDDHPTLTTYFEGEIIGTKYGFLTQHPSWGANDKVDLSHWGKFPAFRPFQKQARKGEHAKIDFSNRDCIFMRWKEHFLVPDHRVRTINGASFEGFYYICFNQVRGEVSGIYFHSRSEKFQQLELKHIEDKGCFAAMEFR